MQRDDAYVRVLDELLDLHYTKSSGYGTEDDPYANFTAVAAVSGAPAWVYPLRRAVEKLTRIESLLAQGRLGEIEEEHLDIASLVVCAEVLRRRTKPAAEEANPPPTGRRATSPAHVPSAAPDSFAVPRIGMTSLVGQAIASAEPGHLETGLSGDDRCLLCDRELDPDDHRTSPYRRGYAHDECIEFHGHALFTERLHEMARILLATRGYLRETEIIEISAALRTAADLIGPERSEGSYVAPCARDDRAESRISEGPGVRHAAHTSCKSPVFRSDRTAGEMLRSRIESRAGQDTTGVGRHAPSPATAEPARLRDAHRGDDGWVRA